MRIRQRNTVRLREYDYTQEGAYFVTACVQGRGCCLGVVMDENVLLTETGRIVKQWWYAIPGHFPNLTLDEFIVMPSHIHGILVFENPAGAGAPRPTPREVDSRIAGESSRGQGAETAPLRGDTRPDSDDRVGARSPRPTPGESDSRIEKAPPPSAGVETTPLHRPTLGQVMAYFKYQSTKSVNTLRGTPGVKFWQRNYYDHIIRNEEDLNEKRRYIELNPLKWALDPENPESK